jgi:hypothetical protein
MKHNKDAIGSIVQPLTTAEVSELCDHLLLSREYLLQLADSHRCLHASASVIDMFVAHASRTLILANRLKGKD